jgi:hypothetical protein
MELKYSNESSIGCEDVYWTELAQDMDWWQALVNTVMNLQVP